MKKEGKRSKYLLLLLVVMGIALIIWTLWGNTALMINEITISDGHIPQAFSGFRIAQVSDLHNTEFEEGNEKLLQMLAECDPDIIVITGDLVDASHTDIDVALVFADEAAKISPTYYVSGNHEAVISQYDVLKSCLETSGVIMLEDEAISLERNGDSITLIGLSDPDATIKGDLFGEVPTMVSTKLRSLMEGNSGYTILLSHRPELFENYVSNNIDLVLSGHAHGGQFRLPFVGGLIAPNQGMFPKYDAGLYTGGNTNMVVSRGIGNSIIPIRFNNRPEIVVVTLISL